jgi:hypothetical protein
MCSLLKKYKLISSSYNLFKLGFTAIPHLIRFESQLLSNRNLVS